MCRSRAYTRQHEFAEFLTRHHIPKLNSCRAGREFVSLAVEFNHARRGNRAAVDGFKPIDQLSRR